MRENGRSRPIVAVYSSRLADDRRVRPGSVRLPALSGVAVKDFEFILLTFVLMGLLVLCAKGAERL